MYLEWVDFLELGCTHIFSFFFPISLIASILIEDLHQHNICPVWLVGTFRSSANFQQDNTAHIYFMQLIAKKIARNFIAVCILYSFIIFFYNKNEDKKI